MTVEEVYELLERLIESGMGDYLVSIKCFERYVEHAKRIEVDEETQDVYIKGA